MKPSTVAATFLIALLLVRIAGAADPGTPQSKPVPDGGLRAADAPANAQDEPRKLSGEVVQRGGLAASPIPGSSVALAPAAVHPPSTFLALVCTALLGLFGHHLKRRCK